MSTVEQTKIDAFRAKIAQRKACEKKAFDTSMQLIEENRVENETLIHAASLIDQERYRGVNEDRALKQICGYPICSITLPKDIPKHQYFINAKVNKVVDTTERRLFCSTFCYKASKYFEQQIPTSPVWARQQQANEPFKVDLLTQETLNKALQDKSIIISHSTYTHSIPKLRRDSSSSSASDDEFETLQLARDEYYKSRVAIKPKLSLVENKLQQTPLPDYIRTDNTTIDFVITCLYEWITDKSKDYLQNNPTTSVTSIDPQRYEQLVRKVDMNELMSFDGSRGEKKLPSIDELQKTTANNQYELKVKEFLFGKEVTLKEETSSASAGIVLPPVDAYSQQTIRLSIVSEKIMTCFKQIFLDGLGHITINNLRSTLSDLLLTFSFTGENITLNPNEWTIMTLFLMHLLTIKLPMLSSHLTASRIIHSLLESLNISSDMILHIVKYLLNNPTETHSSASKSLITNFEDID